MFRVLLIIGLLIAGAQQGFARGSVGMSASELPVVMTMDLAIAQLHEKECCSEQPVAETKPSYCKNSECKAVMAAASFNSLSGQDHPDWVSVRHHTSVPERLEPKPPNS
ncbi:hypothetical protein [Roseibium sp. MMSF_3544]|uniref:hypothetical protein n=1 Tax=unclassified Roseibium TaxID=2629323 RepID=UPI00273D7115|nr:hypothetical protein [Roseibium sp. MMSF_3544]